MRRSFGRFDQEVVEAALAGGLKVRLRFVRRTALPSFRIPAGGEIKPGDG
jgi:hypothetical protein